MATLSRTKETDYLVPDLRTVTDVQHSENTPPLQLKCMLCPCFQTANSCLLLQGQCPVLHEAFPDIPLPRVSEMSLCKSTDTGARHTVFTSQLPLGICATMGKLLNLSVPQSPYLQNGDANSIYFIALLIKCVNTCEALTRMPPIQ